MPSQCAYHLIFETSPPPDSAALRTHEEIPRPFVMAPCQTLAGQANAQHRSAFLKGEELRFRLTLIGRAQHYFPYFVIALREVNAIGRGRRAVELSRIDALDPITGDAQLVYDAHENLVRACGVVLSLEACAEAAVPGNSTTIEFLTQTRLKHQGRFVRAPEFQILFRRLLGRLSSMARFHCGMPLDVDFRGLIEQAANVQLVRDQTRWTTWQRFSSRQDRLMEWEGIVGRATYLGDFAPFWKYLSFGQYTHVGHGCTFGLGKYAISHEQRSSHAQST